MPIDDPKRSLSDGGTFAGQPEVDRDDVSLGGEATFAGSSKRRAADMSLGDERTFGDRLDDQETVIDDIEIVDLAARYRTEGTLGRGGMGEVLLALDTRLDRKVAIKRILGEAARSKTAVSRFLTEAKAIAALNHPNIVQIYDYGRAKDGPFLIMEYVDGSSLLDRCRDGAMPLDAAVDLACQLCDGLGKAHDLGIVHRDIKPANVLLTKDGLPKLTDFGLAKAEAADHQMTMTGAVLGTPDFMPPEQRKDAALVDHRSDLWSLAATVYQMVTGRSPKIIRFDLLPAGLTEVLGKALEETKEDRYQTARELRDALKASLAATAPAAAELSAGQCPSCGVKNDSSRRFCRGCGESLEAPCLSCSKPMPMWEEICGQCGTKQGSLLEERRGEMAARQAEAESLLKDYDFEHAESITVALRDEADSRLKQLTPWATAFLPKISAARDAQLAQALATLVEARKHESSFDYSSAIHALEQVPEILRSRPLGGQAETVGVVLARVAARQAEVERLESFVKARIAAKELGGLLPEVRKLLELRPDRTDVAKLCKQLEERQQKLVAQRDEALKIAKSYLDAKDYESVVAVLRKVDQSVETPEVGQLRDASAINIKALQSLMQEISQSVSQKQVDGLIPKVQTALSLSPGHPELLKLLDSLQAREAKVSAGIQHVVAQAEESFKACQFDKAVAILQRISAERRNSEVVELLDRCEYLAMTKAGVTSGFEGLPKVSDLAEVEGLDLGGLTTRGRSYLGQIAMHGLADPAIEQWCDRCQAAAQKRKAAEETQLLARAILRRILIGTAAAVAAIVFVATSLAIRSSWRSASAQAAANRGDWQAALRLDPENVVAILGQAKSKLAAVPPDYQGVLTELKRAERIDPAAPELRKVRGLIDCRKKFDAAVSIEDWPTALRIATDATTADQASAAWVGPAVVSLPPAALTFLPSLPPATLLSLPPIRNSIGIELKVLPPGKFLMGHVGATNGEPPHLVQLTKPFCIGVYEVTNAQWSRVMGKVPSKWKDDERPLEQVSWDDAVEFCHKLSEMPEERAAGRSYRLPTEAEWEYACRSSTTTRHYFGDDDSALEDFGWFQLNSSQQTHRVGQKKPNPWGLYDMCGNVWEWTSDWFNKYSQVSVTDPVGDPRRSQSLRRRVVRGGDWNSSPEACQSAVRNVAEAGSRSEGLGFRLAVSFNDPTTTKSPVNAANSQRENSE